MSIIISYIAAVDNFIYLGSTLSQVVHIDAEINSRKQLLLRAAFGRLHEKVWDRTGIRVHTELKAGLKVYKLL